MSSIPFDEKELEVIGGVPSFMGTMNPVYNFPVTMKENMRKAVMEKRPMWMPTDIENMTFCPSVIPDNIARGFVIEGKPLPREQFGGPDMFGVEWVYIDVAGGSMVKPGTPLLEDANDWKEKIVFPDIDSWDWEGSAALNKEFLESNRFNELMLLNGCWFERLISFMDFEEAAVTITIPPLTIVTIPGKIALIPHAGINATHIIIHIRFFKDGYLTMASITDSNNGKRIAKLRINGLDDPARIGALSA